LVLKFLHKFFAKADIPWVNLIWPHYYSSGKLPGQHKKGSLWWRDVVSLLDKFKSIASVIVADLDPLFFFGKIIGMA
jgi:hypothetical protein